MATPNPIMSLNLILGRSARAAISTLERCQAANTLCVVSPSPRAERRMSDEDLIQTFTYMGECLKRMVRMETHFYSSNFLWLPAKALTAFLRKADKLEDFLLNGVRIKGTDRDIVELGIALLQHPRLRKITFFNIAPHRDPSKCIGSEVDLLPVLEGASRNANVRQFELRYASWANHHLGAIVSPRFSQITNLSMSGIDSLYGPNGDGINQGFPDLMEGLKTNVRLQELKICQAPGPVGTGALVAEMLRENCHLKRLTIHLAHVADALPIAEALAHDNGSLTFLEVRWPDPPQNNTEHDPEVRKREIEAAQDAYETALLTNGGLRDIKLISRSTDHSTENMAFYTRMNAAGRIEILMDDELTAEEALEFLETNSEDTSTVHHMILSKVCMLPLVVDYCSVPRKFKKAPPKQCESDSDSDDDLPIKFLVSKAKAAGSDDDLPIMFLASKAKAVKGKRKRAKQGKTNIQARPARTLKRRRRS